MGGQKIGRLAVIDQILKIALEVVVWLPGLLAVRLRVPVLLSCMVRSLSVEYLVSHL